MNNIRTNGPIRTTRRRIAGVTLLLLILFTSASDRTDPVRTGSVGVASPPNQSIRVLRWRQSTLVISRAPFEARIRSLNTKSGPGFESVLSTKDTLRLPTEPKGYVLEIRGIPGSASEPDTTLRIGPDGTPSPFPGLGPPAR